MKINGVETPVAGERWHYPKGATVQNTAARSVVIVAVLTDEGTEDPTVPDSPMRLVVYRQWSKRRGWRFHVEEAWIMIRPDLGWARGPLPRSWKEVQP